MLLDPGCEIDYDGQLLRYPHIRLVYWLRRQSLHHHQDLHRLVRAWQRPETVIVHDSWWTPVARFADIVVPVATMLERDDFAAVPVRSLLSAAHKAVEPPDGVVTDYESSAVAERLGFEKEFTEGRDADEWVRHLYDSTRARLEGRGEVIPIFASSGAPGASSFQSASPHRREALPSYARPDFHPLFHALGSHRALLPDDCRLRIRGLPGHPAWLEPAEWLRGATG